METHSFWISNASVPPPRSLAFTLLIKHENPQPHVIPGLPHSLSAFLISKLLPRYPFAWGGVSTEPLSLGGGCDVKVFKVTELRPPSPCKAIALPFTLARSEGILGNPEAGFGKVFLYG